MTEEKAKPTEEKKPAAGVPEQKRKKPEPKTPKVPGREIITAKRLIRIMQTDIPGNKNLYTGLTKIKGVSWAISNALCVLTGLDKKTKIETLSKQDIEKIENLLRNPNLPKFLINRRKDFATGEDKHLIGSDLDLTKEFDIKRLKKIRSYRGLRHATGQPTRGQRTRSHFRENKKAGVGIKVKKAARTEAAGEKK